MIAAFGHDDRICSYALMQAIFSAKDVKKTQICAWVDREEIGSEGVSGAKAIFFEKFVSTLLKLNGEKSGLENVYEVFSKSQAVSADVTAAVDPDYRDVHDLRNASRMGFGIALEKHTGSGGKYDTSEASAEFIQEIRMILAKNKNMPYQLSGGLGKVDQGGGGTIAMYMANRDIEIVDMGVA